LASEEWRIILTEDLGGGAAPGAGVSPAAKAEQETAQEIKKAGPQWANAGKFAGGLLGVVGTLALVIQMIRRSRIFTTFMDSFLLVFSAFIDIMMIPLIPIFGAALRWIVKLFPHIFKLQEEISKFLKDPWGGIKDLFAKIPDVIKWLGDKIGGFFSALGLGGLGDLFKSIGEKFGSAFEKIVPIFSDWIDKIHEIWGDKSTALWEKITKTAGVTWDYIAKAGKVVWDTIKDIWKSDIAPFFKNIWNTIVIAWIKEKWTEVSNWIKEKWEVYVVQPFKENWNYLIHTYLPDLWKWFTVSWLPVAFHNVIVQIPSMIANALKSLPGLIWDVLTGKKASPPEPFPVPEWPGGQFGIPRVPQTGLYLLHRGEEVISSAARSIYNQNRSINVSNIFNITTDAAFLARKVSTTLDEEVRSAYLRVF